MPTRFYFPLTGLALGPPAFDASWSSKVKFSTTGAMMLEMKTQKINAPITVGRTVNCAVAAGAAALERQYVSPPLWGDQIINGTVSGQLMGRYFATSDNCDSYIPVLRVVDRAGGTVRGTLLPSGNYAGIGTAMEFVNNATCLNRMIYSGQSVTQVNALDGDRIVLEIGIGNSAAGTTPQFAIKWGCNAPDLPNNNTQTTDGAGWFQLNGVNLIFKKNVAMEINDEGGM